MSDVNHHECPPGAHTFDAGDPHYEGHVDEHGNQRCNDCGEPMFYCTRDNWYHHAGKDTGPCFLIRDEGWDIPAPPRGAHCYQLGDGGWRCTAHQGGDCPPFDPGVLVHATAGIGYLTAAGVFAATAALPGTGSLTAAVALPPVGIPYAEAGVDERGYHHICPFCGERCYGPRNGDEDEVTKGAARAYGVHYEESHRADA